MRSTGTIGFGAYRVTVKGQVQNGLNLMSIVYAPGDSKSAWSVHLEQPILIRQYTCAVRSLALRGHTLRDETPDIQQGALHGVGDRTQTEEERERDQRDICGDGIADRTEYISGLQLVQEDADVEGGQRDGQGVDRVSDRQQGRVVGGQRGAQIVEDVGQRGEQRGVRKRKTAA